MILCSVCNVDSAYATTIKTESKEVLGQTQKAKEKKIIYKVDVVWGSMSFCYNTTIKREWNNAKHNYDETAVSKWIGLEDMLTSQNDDIKADFKYLAATSYSHIKGSFNNSDTLVLPSAEGKSTSSVDIIGTKKLLLSGQLDDKQQDYVEVGTINISIN